MDITEGIITQTYPSIFLIQIDDAGSDAVKTMSFSYADVLTKDVQMMLC
ncbi:Veg family protein [Anaerocolumna sedimenticola]|nr:Veg family protein [Anaerocolumna sedimenticola]